MKSKRCSWTLVAWSVAWALLGGGFSGCGGASALAWAQSAPAIATTTVTDTVYNADGSPAAGTVLIRWPAFVTAGGSNIPAGETSVTLGANGLLSVALVPNAGSTPMGSYYTVVYHLANGAATRQYWVVPALPAGGATAVKVSAISTTVLPASVAMQTVSKSYVDQAIAAATTGSPADTSPYVQKAGDTMTGPLVLPGDPVAPLQAAEKQYVDEQIASVSGGVGQKVSESPVATQVVTQPAGTDLAVNNLNGALYASQYVSGSGNNGIANAVASTNCTSGCDVVADHGYASAEPVVAANLNAATRVEDRRNGRVASTSLNPLNSLLPGDNNANAMDMASTRSASSLFALNGAEEQFAITLKLSNEALAGGANVFPQNVQNSTPYFKTTYSALSTNGTSNTPGQHVLKPSQQICYSVGDCLMGSEYMVTSGGLRDDADEGSHPYDLDYSEDTQVFTGTCTSGCTTGSTVVSITPATAAGTQGEGRYLLVTTPSKVISTGTLIGGSTGALQQVASFSGTSFPLSTFLQTAQSIPPQANNIAPGTVSVAIVTSAAPAGYAASTAALPATSGVACIAGQANQLNSIVDFETAAYTVVDGGHLQLTLTRPHETGATIAVGGLCGYGLEQKVDTAAGIRQVFPVIGSPSATTLYYAAGSTTIVGQSSTSGYMNLNQVIAAISRSGNMVTLTTTGNMAQDFSGLPLTVQGVADASYNGTFTVTSTSAYTLTYAQTGANSTSSGGTVSYVTGGYALYPMAEVVNVYNTATRAIDGQMTLAANTVNWAPGDTVEQPHYFQQRVSADLQFVTQYTPRPALLQTAGIHYLGNNGSGLNGWEVANETATSAYFGMGGTHQLPNAGMAVYGPWKTSLDLEAGTGAVLAVHCNLHGCGRWNSAYNLMQMDSNQGTDTIAYSPLTSALTVTLDGTGYGFTPQGFTAGTINATHLNASTISGQFSGSISASSLPVFGASGSAHSAGAVPDPGATAGTSRYLREDGSWTAPTGGGGGATLPSSGLVYATSPTTATAATPAQVAAALGAGLSANAPMVGTGSSVSSLRPIAAQWFFGDSFMAGFGATVASQTSFEALMARDTPAPSYQFGVGSTTAPQIANSVFLNFAPNPLTPSVVQLDGGANDDQVDSCGGGLGTNCTASFAETMEAMEVWAATPVNYRTMGSAATQTGTWTADTSLPVYVSPTLASPGTQVKSTTASSTLTFAIPSSASGVVGLTWAVTNAQTGTFTVSVDGAPVTDACSGTTTFSSGPCGGISLPVQSGTVATTGTFYHQHWAVAQNAAHTVVVTTTNGGNVSILGADWAPPATAAGVNAVFVTGVIFGNYVATYNAVSQTTANALKSAGYPVYFVDIKSGTPGITSAGTSSTATATAAASTDAGHPNDLGASQWEQTTYNTEVANNYVFSTFETSGTGAQNSTVEVDSSGNSIVTAPGSIYFLPGNKNPLWTLGASAAPAYKSGTPYINALGQLWAVSSTFSQLNVFGTGATVSTGFNMGRSVGSTDFQFIVPGSAGAGCNNDAVGDTCLKPSGDLWFAPRSNGSSWHFTSSGLNFLTTNASSYVNWNIGRSGTDMSIFVASSSGMAVNGSVAGDWIQKGNGANQWFSVSGSSSPSLQVDSTGVAANLYQPLTLYSAAGTALPACGSSLKGTRAVVSDATSPTYMGAYASGGAITAEVICSYNGSSYSWLTH